MMLDTADNKIFFPRFYDIDTCCSYDNSGQLKFDVDIEMEQGYWNTSSSRLWTRIRDLMHNDIVTTYNNMRQNGVSYENMMKYIYDEQIAKISQTYYNKDYDIKYAPFADSYIGMAHGDTYEHVKRWLTQRFRFVDTLFDYAPSYNNDVLTIRANTTELMTLEIETYTPVYQHLSWYNGQMDKKKIDGKVSVEFSGTAQAATDQEVLIYGGSNVKSIKGITSMNPNRMLIGSATKLVEIDAHDCPLLADINANKANLSPHEYLNKVNLSNCPLLEGNLRLNNSPLIQEVNMRGTNITDINFPTSLRNLKVLRLSDNMSNISYSNLGLLDTIEFGNNIQFISLKNMPNLNTISYNNCENLVTLILEDIKANPSGIISSANNLKNIRLINIDVTTNVNIIKRLMLIKGLDENGIETNIGNSVTGIITLTECSQELEEEFKETFPKVTFKVLEYVDTYTVTFVNGDGDVIGTDKVLKGGEAIYLGDTPTKSPIDQYEYIWDGWDKVLRPINGDVTITATFIAKTRIYTIRFINSITQEVLSTQNLEYGTKPTPPSLPTGENTWSPYVSKVTQSVDYMSAYVPYPEDLSIFTFTSTTYEDDTAYICTLNTATTTPNLLIIPFEYNGCRVIEYKGNSNFSFSYVGNTVGVYIPESIVTLGDYAFYNFSGLTEIDIPESVTKLGTSAFGYTSIISINTKNVASMGSSAFVNCSSLIYATLPKATLYQKAFANCSNLKYVILGCKESPVTSLYTSTSVSYTPFYYCSNLRSVVTITSDGEKIVANNYIGSTSSSSGDGIYVSSPIIRATSENAQFKILEDGTVYIIHDTYASLVSLSTTATTVDSSIDDLPITILERHACSRCSSLTSVNLPNIHTIGDYSFNYCTSLTSVNLPNALTMGEHSFYYCSSLTSVNLPNVTDGGRYCFYRCSSLTSINLPNLLTLDFYFFEYCSELIYAYLPKVTEIPNWSFSNCSKLRWVIVGSEEYPFTKIEGTSSSSSSSYPFYNSGVIGIIMCTENGLPDDITLDGYFISGANSKDDYRLQYTSKNVHFENIDNALYIIFSDEARLAIANITSTSFTEYSILENINNIPVTMLERDCFKDCSDLLTLKIPSTITKLTSRVFYNCTKLEEIDFSECSNIKISNAYRMFYNCNNLTSLDLSNFDTSNVTDMSSMFYNCSSLTSLDLSGFDTSNVTNMTSMFSNCSSLTSLELSGFDTLNVTNMTSMFYGCNKLTFLELSEFDTSNVTNMGSMFYSCNKLTSLDLSGFNTSNVTNMDSMFYNCSGLTSLDLSGFDTSNVTNMGSMFRGCSKLTSLDSMQNISVALILSYTILDATSLLDVINNLATVATSQTLTLGSTLLAKLTEDQIAIATNKGWTVA